MSVCLALYLGNSRPRTRSAHLQVLLQALKVEPDRLLVVIRVRLDLEARVAEDGDVVAPRRARDVDLLGVRVVTGEERASDAQRARTGERLGDGDLRVVGGGSRSSACDFLEERGRGANTHTALGQGLRVGTVSEHGSCLGKGAETSDREVLLVVALADDLVLGLCARGPRQLCARTADRQVETHGEDRGEDVGLAVGVAVGADAQVDLLRARVLLERLRDACSGSSRSGLRHALWIGREVRTEDGVGRAGGDLCPDGDGAGSRGCAELTDGDAAAGEHL